MSEEVELHCSVHDKPAKYTCGVCGKPVCEDCRPRGLNFQVYHPECINKARNKMDEQQLDREEVEAPSIGVKTFSWVFIIGGMLLFGLGVFFLIFSFVGTQVPVRALLNGTVSPSLDSIPGARTALTWAGVISLVLSVLIGVLGVGILNCVAAARRVLLLFAWMELTVAILAWIMIGLTGKGFWDIPVLAVIVIAYFSRRKVKKQFDQVL